MSMTKRDFQTIASHIARHNRRAAVDGGDLFTDSQLDTLSNAFYISNPRFDRVRFYTAIRSEEAIQDAPQAETPTFADEDAHGSAETHDYSRNHQF